MNRLMISLMAVIVAGAAFAQAKPKPAAPKAQTTCVITGETLGGMGKPVEVAYTGKNAKFKGKSVKVCCGGCVAKVNKDQDKYFTKVFGKS